MKKLCLTAALAVTTAMPSFADDVDALSINHSGGKTDIEVSEILSIKFTDSDMVVNMRDGSAHTFAMNEIALIEFGTMASAIQSLLAENEDNATYSITDLKGRVVAQGKMDKGKTASIPAAKGIYIVTVGEKSHKILIK